MRIDSWSGARKWIALLVGVSCSFVATAGVAAQTATAARPQFKGIWEPVSYTEDLDLKDVFFVTAEVGWAAGASGTIIHTKDGGATWTAQLGGDPASSETEIRMLRFIDEHRGWALQGRKLLHTKNGQDWREVSGALPNWSSDYAFVSPRRGVASGTLSSVGNATDVFLTLDGGKSWKPVAQCGLKVQIDGLNRSVGCRVSRFQFPTPQVGYLVGYIECIGVGCGGPPVIGMTKDGGASWRFRLGPGDLKTSQLKDVFFTDERNGFVHAHDASGHKIFSTSDGGETWNGVVGSPGEWLRFADPEVGWAFEEQKLSYTTDGGARWSSRPHRFPANPRAISFPRRDRGYVAGDNGMVFRYRVVPAAQVTPPEVVVTVAMPAFSSPLGNQVAQLDQIVDSLQLLVQRLPAATKAADSKAVASANPASTDTVTALANPALTDTMAAAPVAADAAAPVAVDMNAPFDAALPAASPFTANCCAKPFSRLETILGAIAGSLPQFIAKNRNTNLLLAAVRMFADLPGQFRSVKGGLAAFRTATDQGAAAAALAQVTTAIETFKTQTSAALQKELPPLEMGGGQPLGEQPAPVGGEAPVVEQVQVVEQAADSVVDSTAAIVKKKAADAAKKGIGGFLKKKLKIP